MSGWILTFHAACGRILRREAARLGYRSNFTIYDQADQIRLVKQCLQELDRDPKRFTPRGIHSVISREKNNLVGPVEFRARVSSFYDQTVADVYDLYQRRLFASNAVDFDDLLYLTVDTLERFPEARERWRKAFHYVLVDEYQDTNHAQYRLLQLLASEHGNVCAVGDPDQCLAEGTLITMGDGSVKRIEQVVSPAREPWNVQPSRSKSGTKYCRRMAAAASVRLASPGSTRPTLSRVWPSLPRRDDVSSRLRSTSTSPGSRQGRRRSFT